MPISPMDEYMAHQFPEPFDTVYTSDRHFYDRYYFNMHSSSDELFLVTGIGQYPNLGVIDAFVSVAKGDKQYTVRASRELGSNRLDSSAGPFRFEVIEGLRSLRLVCEPNEWGIAFDLRFDGTVAALAEPKSLTFRGPRKTQDTFRYAQVGAYTGTLELHGTRYDVTPDRWWGARDHSWGVRPVGEPEPPGIGAKPPAPGAPMGFFHNWMPIQFPDSMIKITIDERADGTRINEEGERLWGIDSDRPAEHIGSPHVDVSYISGTREIASSVLTFTDHDGNQVGPTITCTPLITVYLKAGSGYSYDGHWGHGVYQGPLAVEGVTHDIGAPHERLHLSWLNETLCRYDSSDGSVGYGLYENLVAGVHLPSGFTRPDTMAP
jgi:hypothetical protein